MGHSTIKFKKRTAHIPPPPNVRIVRDPQFIKLAYPLLGAIRSDAEKAHLDAVDKACISQDRLWSIFGAFLVLNSHRPLAPLLQGLQIMVVTSCALVFGLTLKVEWHHKWRRRVLSVIRTPVGIAVSLMTSAAFRRKPMCVQTWGGFITQTGSSGVTVEVLGVQVMVARGRCMTPLMFTGAWHLGVLHHFLFQVSYVSWLLVSMNHQDCAVLLEAPNIPRMLTSLGSELTHAISQFCSIVGLPNQAPEIIGPAETCLLVRGGLEVAMLVSTTVAVYLVDMRERYKFAQRYAFNP